MSTESVVHADKSWRSVLFYSQVKPSDQLYDIFLLRMFLFFTRGVFQAP